MGESESLAAQVNDNGGLYFVPAFAGLFAPYWRDDARGVIVGMTAFNNKSHIVRAALESAAFQVREGKKVIFPFLSPCPSTYTNPPASSPPLTGSRSTGSHAS